MHSSFDCVAAYGLRDDEMMAAAALRAALAVLLVQAGGATELHLHRVAARRAVLHSGALAAATAAFSPSAYPLSTLPAYAAAPPTAKPTNAVLRSVAGIRRKRVGGTDIEVSEIGLGTQRWGSTDFNAPDEALCHKLLDRAVLECGVNLIDTAEQYPIPSDRFSPEGATERIIGSWLAKDRRRREQVVIASKITGGPNVNARNIERDLQGSLKRLGTDYLDLYLLHWPARYTPQSNWGMSLEYNPEIESYSRGRASFEEVAEAMGKAVQKGLIRGWGICNDNAYGLAASSYTAKLLNTAPPCVMQNGYSLINRRIEENGLSEASAAVHENAGFFAYNALAGGVLTGKYLDTPAAVDDPRKDSAMRTLAAPRGRMDDVGWGRTLYRYRSAAAQEAVRRYAQLAAANGLSLTELSLRWCRTRAPVTSVLLGVSSMRQLEEDVAAFRNPKPLPPELLWDIDRVHMMNRLPIFASTRVGADWYGEGEIGEPIP